MDSSVTARGELQKSCRAVTQFPGVVRPFKVKRAKVKRFTTRIRLLVLLASAASAFSGCGKDVGDSCMTSADCDPNGTRVCDLSQPGGYCTVLGCDQSSCPSDSVCIRYFPTQYLTVPCQTDSDCCPMTSPADGGASMSKCTGDELCLPVVGLCSRRSNEARACAKTCNDNSDCRGGYDCRRTGTPGAGLLLATDPNSTATYCAPNGS
jgi:hypothetical protein